MRTDHCRSCGLSGEGWMERGKYLSMGIILVSSIILKLIVMMYLDGRVYYDVVKALNFGYLVHHQTFSIDADIINSKTFLGPLIWFHIYRTGSLVGLQLFSLLVFVLLFVTVYALGKDVMAHARSSWPSFCLRSMQARTEISQRENRMTILRRCSLAWACYFTSIPAVYSHLLC